MYKQNKQIYMASKPNNFSKEIIFHKKVLVYVKNSLSTQKKTKKQKQNTGKRKALSTKCRQPPIFFSHTHTVFYFYKR